VAVVIGIVAIDGLLLNGLQLIGAGGWSFLLLLPLFSLLCSLAGAWSAYQMWCFRPLGWWVAAWYCIFGLLGTFAPSLIFGRFPDLGALQVVWLFLLCVSLAYLFTPSTMVFYRISAGWRRASVSVVGAALLCILVLFAYPAYFAVRATWFSN
jgi:hypothetical protein